MKSHAYNEPRWRVRETLHTLGSYDTIAQLIVDKGYPRLPVGTISAWASRNSIPSPWLPVILDLAMEARLIGSIDDFKVVQ